MQSAGRKNVTQRLEVYFENKKTPKLKSRFSGFTEVKNINQFFKSIKKVIEN